MAVLILYNPVRESRRHADIPFGSECTFVLKRKDHKRLAETKKRLDANIGKCTWMTFSANASATKSLNNTMFFSTNGITAP
jgi:hypothetical protein